MAKGPADAKKREEDWKKKLLLEEMANRNLLKRPLGLKLRSPEFALQNKILDDPARFKALNATRRAAKSETEVRAHIECALKYPWSKQIYMGITRESVAEICWDVFKRLDEEVGLNLKFNNADYVITFPNHSKIRLFGADVSHHEIRKVLGQKVRKVSIDEAGSFNVDIEMMVKKSIRPTLIDLQPFSWLTLLGTCENIPNTYFEKVTMGLDHDINWKVYRWNSYDNPFIKDNWDIEIRELMKNNPEVIHSSWFKTHYLNEWVADQDLLVIPINPSHIVEEVPDGSWFHVLGVDLGYNDDTAFSICCYSEDSPVAYCVYVEKSKEMDFTQVATRIKQLVKLYDVGKIVVDGANKQGLEEMRRRHKLPLQAVEKTTNGPGNFKVTALRMLKDDILTGNLKLIRGQTEPIIKEWGSLQFKDKRKDKEDPRCANHASDATLYAVMSCLNYGYEKPEERLSSQTEAYMEKEEEKEAEAMAKFNRKNSRFVGVEDDYDWGDSAEDSEEPQDIVKDVLGGW